MNKQIKLLVNETVSERLDVFLTKKFPEYSRNYFQKIISAGGLLVNGCTVLPSYKVRNEDAVEFSFTEKKCDVEPENIPFDVIYEDKDILVIDKPAGLVVHPACGHESGTLVNAALYHFKGKFRPLLVHRLDKGTTGVIVIAKNERAKNSLVKQFQKRVVKKTYIAVLHGLIDEKKGRIEAPLGRSPEDRKKIIVGPLSTKPAVTEFEVINKTGKYTVVRAFPLTGRTHQIRSHFSYIGHPLLGDETYGGKTESENGKIYRPMLHANSISFTHPSLHKTVEFSAPIPKDIKSYL